MALGPDTVNSLHARGNDVDEDRRQQHCGYKNRERPAQGIFLFHSRVTSVDRANAL